MNLVENLHLLQRTAFGTQPAHAYMLCGWRTLSEIVLTGMPTLIDDALSCDVIIQFASGKSPLAAISPNRFVFQHSADCSIIRIKDVGDFEIRGGQKIQIWPMAGATHKDIEIFLFGPAWATLCHQRGILPLHASAIATGNSITAFAGHSGTGKSTTAALLNALGHELIADDILPVSFNQDRTPGAWPYLRRLKLHRDPIDHLALTPSEMVSETLDTKKYFVPPKRTGDDEWRRLDRIYVLENDLTNSHPAIERITGADAVRALVDQTYHFNFISGSRRFGDHLEFCTRLASKILIYRLRRPQLPLSKGGTKLVSAIRAHLKGRS